MLSDPLRQLLTAYVDGELTNRQRKAVGRLLRRSPEARGLLRQLQEDARRIHALPRQHLDEEFSVRVVRAVRQRQAQERRGRAVRAAAFPTWAGIAAAAAVLLAVSAGSFVYFARPANDTPAGRQLAANGQPAERPPETLPAPKEEPKGEGGTALANARSAPALKPQEPPPEQLPLPVAVNDKPKGPVNPVDVVTQETPLPNMEMFRPAVVKPPFALLENVHDIQAAQLRKEFGAEMALRVELPCADTAQGFRRLKDALKDAGITLAIDPAVQNRLDKPRLRSNYVLFVEDLTADELAHALAKLGGDDRKAVDAKRRPDHQFSKMVVNRLSDADRKELSDVLHVDPRLLQAGAGKGKGAERLALAVTYNPEQGRPRPNSPEVKRYLEGRRPARPGALQVLLVLRETPR